MPDFIECRFVLSKKRFKEERIEKIVKELSKVEEVMTRAEWIRRYLKDLNNTEFYSKILEDTKKRTNVVEIVDQIGNERLDRLLSWGEDRKAPKEVINVELSGDDRFHSPLNFLNDDERWEDIDKEVREYALTATNNFVRDTKVIYDAIHPEYGFANWTEAGLRAINKDIHKSVFWLNFYGPAMVKKIGKEKLLTTPAYQVEEMKDGGVFLRLNETWLNLSINNADLKREIAVAKHLGFERGRTE